MDPDDLSGNTGHQAASPTLPFYRGTHSPQKPPLPESSHLKAGAPPHPAARRQSAARRYLVYETKGVLSILFRCTLRMYRLFQKCCREVPRSFVDTPAFTHKSTFTQHAHTTCTYCTHIRHRNTHTTTVHQMHTPTHCCTGLSIEPTCPPSSHLSASPACRRTLELSLLTLALPHRKRGREGHGPHLGIQPLFPTAVCSSA